MKTIGRASFRITRDGEFVTSGPVFELFREKAENDRKHFLYMARKQGIEQGELEDKHNVLIRQLELKYSLSGDERKHIFSVTDFNKLDAVVLAKDKEN
ncbi:MAG: hypothetical protein KAR21_13865, partial [Spirochaetales bacterium]|nr:hypothetical protein [Spirochaetales bacterium]